MHIAQKSEEKVKVKTAPAPSRKQASLGMWRVLVAITAITLAHPGYCARQQQPERQHQLEQRTMIGQDPYASYSIIGPDSLLELARPNSKRARKVVSAFMPMRGRKDGRDERFGAEQEGETSILRLVEASLGPEVRWTESPALVRQFNDQFAARNQAARDGAEQYEQEDAPALMQAKLRRAFHPMRGKRPQLAFPGED